MSRSSTLPWESLERRGSSLFLLAGVILLVAAGNYAVPFLMDGVEFNYWVGLTVLVGRLVSLLAVAGLTVQVLDRNPRLGKLSRVVVAAAVLFTTGLLASAILENLGHTLPVLPVFALGTILTSILTYSLFGVAILRTGTYSRLVGGLLLVATVALLWGFFSQMVLPERLVGLIGTVAELGLFATHVAIGYQLRTGSGRVDRAKPAADTVSK